MQLKRKEYDWLSPIGVTSMEEDNLRDEYKRIKHDKVMSIVFTPKTIYVMTKEHPRKSKSVLVSDIIYPLFGMYSVYEVEPISLPIYEDNGYWSYRVKVHTEFRYFLWIKYKTVNYGTHSSKR
jgi:hypothetical protein